MMRYLVLFIVGLFAVNVAFAQKDTAVYYLNNSGDVVSTKDSANFFLVILPPDTSVNSKLFVVKEYYKNGRIRLAGNSISNSLIQFQGPQISFFSNGRKMKIAQFEDGRQVGDAVEYYPNGKLYNIKTFTKIKREKYALFDKTDLLLETCNDSIGNPLSVNGNGTWIKFLDMNFKNNYTTGQVKGGYEEGEWHGIMEDSVKYIWLYEKGRLITSYPENSDRQIFTKVDSVPKFPGGQDAFGTFLLYTFHIPAAARDNRTEGRITVSFVVEIDGGLTNVKVIHGIGDGCDEEAVRVMKLSPRWKPGLQNGKAVRVAYSMPINISFGSKN